MQLLDFLMARGRLDAVHRDRVLALRRERGESESVIVTRLGMIDERDMAECLAEFLEIPLAGPGDYRRSLLRERNYLTVLTQADGRSSRDF